MNANSKYPLIDSAYEGLMVIETYLMKRKSHKAFIHGWLKRYFILNLISFNLTYKAHHLSDANKFTLPLQNIQKFTLCSDIKPIKGWTFGFEIYWGTESLKLFACDYYSYSMWINALYSIKVIPEKPLTLTQLAEQTTKKTDITQNINYTMISQIPIQEENKCSLPLLTASSLPKNVVVPEDLLK